MEDERWESVFLVINSNTMTSRQWSKITMNV